MKMVVRVPGTSANLGPGFDMLGVALSVYNTFVFETIAVGVEVSGCNAAYAGEGNLAVQAWRAVERKIGAAPSGVRLKIQSDVPVARGLGSSAALLAAGAKAANHAYGNALSDGELLDLITAMEGHPDNVASALLGGLRASLVKDGKVYSEEFPIHPSVGFCALIPNFEMPTREARAVLPDQITRHDVVFELSHLALTLRALETADWSLLGTAMDDCLHQPYRTALIHEYDRVKAAAAEHGAAALCISGSGSTLLAAVHAQQAAAFAKAMARALADSRFGWRALALKVDCQGAQILEAQGE